MSDAEGFFKIYLPMVCKDSWFVVDDGFKRFVAFMKAVRAADRLPTISVESLMPEALLDGLNPTHITIRLLSALKGIIPTSKC